MSTHARALDMARADGNSKIARRLALLSCTLWGVLHVAGGIALMYTIASDGGRGALESLGSGAAPAEIPLEPGVVTEGVLRFHSLNIALAGFAVSLLATTIARTAWPRGVTSALLIIGSLDLGLIAFLVVPGHMLLTEAMWGPLLLAICAPAAWIAGWRPRQL